MGLLMVGSSGILAGLTIIQLTIQVRFRVVLYQDPKKYVKLHQWPNT